MLLHRLAGVVWLLVLADARFSGPLGIVRLGLEAGGLLVAHSAAALGASLGLAHFSSPDQSIRFEYPTDFVVSEKPLKTHGYEAFLKSASRKGYNEGITVGCAIPRIHAI